jgi:hypothetical protein
MLAAMTNGADISARGEHGATPIDMDVVRRVARALQDESGYDSEWLSRIAEPDFDSYQDFVAHLRHDFDVEMVHCFPELCAVSLGGAGATRVLAGVGELGEPFFHHGDLVVQGGLFVSAPFVVTGSLTVGGVLADCGPDSVVVVGGGVSARGVNTDGEMYVGGAIEADVVYGSYNDNVLQARSIRARLVIEDEHCTMAFVESDHHYDLDTYRQGYGEGVQEQLRALLVDEVFGPQDDKGESRFDARLLFRRLREGAPVFRADVGAHR